MSEQFPRLFSPMQIGSMTVRNRIVMSAHVTGHALDFVPNDRIIAYWAARARGGVGLIGMQLHWVHAVPERNPFYHPQMLDGLRRAAEAVHAHGAKITCQIGNMGAEMGHFGFPSPWAPSAVLGPNSWAEVFMAHTMTTDEIKGMIDSFVHAALLVQQAGIDGVELHNAHGYLLNEFMSPHWNARTDEYGGSLENRMRLPLQVINAVRAAVGPDFAVGMRISGDEFVPGGYTLDDMRTMAPLLTHNGKLDFLNVSAGNYLYASTVVDPMYYPLNSFVQCAAAIKAVVDVPVFARGRIIDPQQAEQILADGHADMVSMVRANIADPEFANKARTGRTDEIRTCIGCNEGCWGQVARFHMDGMSCTMNPATGREHLPGWEVLQPAAVRKHVMVIGGGPAGLETARVAAERGHRVSLYERGAELGGQTLVAAKAPGRESLLDLVRYYSHQMRLLNVAVHLGTEATAQTVQAESPDAVVVATGSAPYFPRFPGAEGANVVEVRTVLNGAAVVGDRVIIVALDNDIQSLSCADFLAERGKQVEVLGRNYDFGSKLDSATKHAIHQRLYRHGITLTPNTGVKEIHGRTVVTYNVFTEAERRIDGVDTVVIACGGQEDNALYCSLKAQVGEIHLAGDANGVRRISDATLDGAIVGRAL